MTLARRSALTDWGRRAVVLGGFAGLIRPGFSAAASAREATSPGLLGSDEEALAFRKLAYSVSPGAGFWWLQGRRYGLVDNQLTPLWDMHVGVIFRTRDLPGGDWEVRSIAQSFYTDLETGSFLTIVRNPYTGRDIKISYFRPEVARVRYRGLAVQAKSPSPGLKVSDRVGPAETEDGVLTIRSDHRVTGVLANRPVQVNDLSTYVGAMKDLRDSSLAMAPAAQTFNDFNSWPDWLEMQDRPGTYLSRAYGRKAFAFADMPQTWRRLLKEVHPDLADDPVGALGV